MPVKYVVGAINMLYILYNPISCICFRNKALLLYKCVRWNKGTDWFKNVT